MYISVALKLMARIPENKFYLDFAVNRDKILERFDRLITQIGSRFSESVDDQALFYRWRINSLSLLEAAFGTKSLYYQEFAEKCKMARWGDAEAGMGILGAAKEDLETGFVSSGSSLDNEALPQELFQGDDGPTQADRRKVFVVHGRNEHIRLEVFRFLRSLHLEPIEWSEAIKLTEEGSPYIGTVLDAVFSDAQAIVVVMTPDDDASQRRESPVG